MNRKKYLYILCAVLLVFVSAASAYCQTEYTESNKNLTSQKLEYDEFLVNEWNEQANNVIDLQGKSMKISECINTLDNDSNASDLFFHNNGNSIDTDLFKNGNNEGNYLVAVYITEKNGIQVLNRYFSNSPSGNKAELVERVTAAQIKKAASGENANIKPRVATGTTYVRYGDYEYKESGYVMAVLTDSITFKKVANAEVDGASGSIWDVVSSVQLEKKNAATLNELYTRLSVAQTHQRMITWGPKGNHSAGHVDFSLGTTGPTASYGFDLEGGKLKDAGSSMSDSYGRWRFYTTLLGNPSSYDFQVGVRATNTSGAFVLEYSHVTNLTGMGAEREYLTGVVQEWVTDR